jgi:hypothetical protein
VNVQFKNEAYGNMRAGEVDGIADSADASRDLNVATEALAGVQANIWEVSKAGSWDTNDADIPTKAINFQYKNYASANMTTADDIADDVAGRDINISTTALAGVQANIVRVGDVALRNK